MDIQTPLEDAPEAVEPQFRSSPESRPATAWTIGLFAIFWLAFYAFDTGLPYLTNGSDLIDRMARIRHAP